MLKNFVKETASAPGTSTTFNLGGATAPFVTFAASFSNGATCQYVMYSTTQAEWGVGTVTHGSPNTLSRTTVVGNTVGTTAKLNFTGTTTVICAPIAEKAVYKNASGDVTIADDLTVGTTLTVSGATVLHDHLYVAGEFNSVGSAVFDSTLTVSGATVLNDHLYVAGEFNSVGSADFDATVRIGAPTVNASLAVASTNPSISAIGTEVPGTSVALAIGFKNGNGAVGTISTSGSTTSYNTSSDYRLKVTYGEADGSMIQRLRVHDAAFLSDGARYPMFLAHELQEDGAGFMVWGEKDGPDMQQLDHSKLIPTLVAYCQKLRTDLDLALARIAAIGK